MINWGILGAGNIAQRFLQSLAFSHDGRIYAIATHSKDKRIAMKRKYPDIMIYDNYTDLLNDKNIDVVYLAMWHKDHYRYAKEAMILHKAVLCEKPATLSLDEMIELAQISKSHKVFFMEAMKTRFIPMTLKIKDIISQGIIGDIKSIENSFCYDISGLNNTRYLFDKDQGGILNDVGSYNIASILDYIDDPIQSIECDVQFKDDIDLHDKITIHFKNDKSGYIEIAMNESKPSTMIITGTLGTIECIPFYRPKRAAITLKDKSYMIKKEYIYDDFYTEIQEVHNCLNHHLTMSQRMTLQDSIDIAKVREDIRKEMAGKKL